MKANNFNQIYNSYSEELFRFLYFKTNNKEDAEDIVSEVFAKYYKQPEGHVQNPRAWLYRVARNTVYDKYVKAKSVSYAEIEEENIRKIEDATQNTEAIAVDESLLEIVRTELGNLDSDSVDVITMKTWNDMTFQEIATALDISVSSAKQKYYRGVDSLKRNVRMNSVTLPVIFMAIKAIGHNINIPNLVFTTSTMTASNIFGGFLATSTGKIAAATAAGVVTIAGVTGAAVAYEQANTPEVTIPNVSYPTSYAFATSSTTSDESSAEMRYEGELLNFAFNYDQSKFGKAKGSSKVIAEEGLNCQTESVTFTDSLASNLTLVLEHGNGECLGSDGGDELRSRQVTTASGEKAVVIEYQSGIITAGFTAGSRTTEDLIKIWATDGAVAYFTFRVDEAQEGLFELAVEVVEALEFDYSNLGNQLTTYKGQELGFTLEYNAKNLGKAAGEYNYNESSDPDDQFYCASESLTFAKSEVEYTYIKGFAECVGAIGGDTVKSREVTTKTGETTAVVIYDAGEGSVNRYTVIAFIGIKDIYTDGAEEVIRIVDYADNLADATSSFYQIINLVKNTEVLSN